MTFVKSIVYSTQRAQHRTVPLAPKVIPSLYSQQLATPAPFSSLDFCLFHNVIEGVQYSIKSFDSGFFYLALHFGGPFHVVCVSVVHTFRLVSGIAMVRKYLPVLFSGFKDY